MASVIYLTDTRYGQRAWQHPSARHRCYHYADALLSQDGHSAVMPLDRVTSATLQGFDHAIFHRPVLSKRFRHALDCCRSSGLRLHADYDDLVFHPDFSEFSPQVIDGGKSQGKVHRQFEDTYAAAQCFNSMLVSTAYLSDKVLSLFPEVSVTVLPNSLPRTFHAPVNHSRKDQQLTIGYFPGSRGHGEDFKSVASVLHEILESGVRLLIVGRLSEQYYKELPNVKHIPFAEYADYLKLLSMVHVSIAPLLENEFNQSKSAVKLIESVSVGTPIVATRNPDMADHDNAMAWLVGDEEQWKNSIIDALDSDQFDDSVVSDLQQRFSVTSRLPVLQEHLRCTA